MRQTTLFLSRFMISLWVMLIIAFVSLLMSNAPNVPSKTPFASVSIKPNSSSIVHLPNQIFTCTETGDQFQCQTKIQARFLNINLTKGSDYKYAFSNCRALYDGRSIGCRKTAQNYAPILSDLYEITDLGLNPQQLQTLRQDYWGINTLMNLGERRLMEIGTVLSLVTGIIAAFLSWFHPGKFSKGFISFVCGVGMAHLVWGVLGRVQYDIVTPYGSTADTWGWVVYGGVIAAGLGTMLATALLLWQNVNRFTRILISIISSVGMVALATNLFMLMLLTLGYAD